MTELLRKLDRHAFTLQTAQLTRVRNYNQNFTITTRHSRNALDWAYDDQDTPVGTDFSTPNTSTPEDKGAAGEE